MIDQFLQDNNLASPLWNRILMDVPPSEQEGEFYLHLSHLGNKQWVYAKDKSKLVEWMKLTETLFL